MTGSSTTRPRSTGRILAGALTAAAISLGAFVSPAVAATPTATADLPQYPCADGHLTDRVVVPQVAETGTAYDVFTVHSDRPADWPAHIPTRQMTPVLSAATITLRYSDEHKCAWGLLQADRKWPDGLVDLGRGAPRVWLDISYDNGQTITFHQQNPSRVKSGFSSTYTGPAGVNERIDRDKSVRACGHGMERYYSYTEADPKVRNPILKPRTGFGAPGPGMVNRQYPTVCTPWFTIKRLEQ